MEFDYVIVGGGTAGCIIARRLAEDASIQVALVEAGPAFEHDDLVLGYHGSVPLRANPKYDFSYGIVEQAKGNSDVLMSRAKMLGGCSSHNDTIAFLPPARDLDEWVALGADGWSMAEVRPYYDRAIERSGVHRLSGDNALARAVRDAALEIGLPDVDVHDDEYEEGVGWLYLNERAGVRQSTAVAYLYPLTELPENLTLYTETWVSRIIFDGERATGIATSRGDVMARCEVVVSAGAIDTPKLLMLSGIGPAGELVDLPGVGAHLVDHLELPVMWRSTRDVGASLSSVDNAFFCKTRPDVDGFDSFFHVILQPYYVPLDLGAQTPPGPREGFCLVPNVAKPKSHGSVRLDVDNPTGPPLIDPAYLTDPDGADERVLMEGVRIARRMATETSLSDWIDAELAPGPGVRSDDEDALRAYIRSASNTAYHPAGTCRIGAVVGPDLSVHGTTGLRVADASVFPSIISVNLCLTVMMIGERCADLLRGR